MSYMYHLVTFHVRKLRHPFTCTSTCITNLKKPLKDILYPFCSASPAHTTLADAPIRVPLPKERVIRSRFKGQRSYRLDKLRMRVSRWVVLLGDTPQENPPAWWLLESDWSNNIMWHWNFFIHSLSLLSLSPSPSFSLFLSLSSPLLVWMVYYQ